MAAISFTTDDDTVYSMSATTKVSISESATTTDSAVETTDTITDNVILQNRVIQMDGIISNINSSKETTLSTDQWISQIRQYRKSKGLYVVQVHDLEFIPNCTITGMQISKTKKEGNTAWLCSLSFKEIRVSVRAKLVDIPEPFADLKDNVNPKKDNGDSSTKDVPEKLSTTGTHALFKYFTDDTGTNTDEEGG